LVRCAHRGAGRFGLPEIAVDHQIRGCDAIYVALADQMKDELVTLDKQQFERGSAVVKTREP
jgi:predicted nucleic acid-binding protein